MKRLVLMIALAASSLYAQDWTPTRIVAITQYLPLARMARASGDVVVKFLLNKHQVGFNKIMPINMTSEIYEALTTGPLHFFRDALHETLPLASIGVYTIWRGTEFVYVGIAGRNLDIDAAHKRMRGVRDRLHSHRLGRRSGDQFAVYVCDRLVLPTLSREEIQQIAAGEKSLDALTLKYIHKNLSYRFAAGMSYPEAMHIETEFARGETQVGPPQLNPRRLKKAH